MSPISGCFVAKHGGFSCVNNECNHRTVTIAIADMFIVANKHNRVNFYHKSMP